MKNVFKFLSKYFFSFHTIKYFKIGAPSTNPQEQDKDDQTTVIKPAGGDEKPKGMLLLFSK